MVIDQSLFYKNMSPETAIDLIIDQLVTELIIIELPYNIGFTIQGRLFGCQ